MEHITPSTLAPAVWELLHKPKRVRKNSLTHTLKQKAQRGEESCSLPSPFVPFFSCDHPIRPFPCVFHERAGEQRQRLCFPLRLASCSDIMKQEELERRYARGHGDLNASRGGELHAMLEG